MDIKPYSCSYTTPRSLPLALRYRALEVPQPRLLSITPGLFLAFLFAVSRGLWLYLNLAAAARPFRWSALFLSCIWWSALFLSCSRLGNLLDGVRCCEGTFCGVYRKFLPSSISQIWRMRAIPIMCRHSSCRLARSGPSCHPAARFTIRWINLAHSGPIPPHVPRAIAAKLQDASEHTASYLVCFSTSFTCRKRRHRSRETVGDEVDAEEGRSDCCHP